MMIMIRSSRKDHQGDFVVFLSTFAKFDAIVKNHRAEESCNARFMEHTLVYH